MPTQAAQPRRSHPPRLLLGRPEDLILRAVNRYPYLTAVQVTRLCGYSARSLTYVQTKLKALSVPGYLLARRAGNERVAGSAPLLYALHRKGRAYLAQLGIAVQAPIKPTELTTLKTMHLAHTKELNDVLIAAELLTRTVPQITLAQLIHERALKRQPFRVALPDGTTQPVIPDAWLDLQVGTHTQRRRFPLAVELDRGTTEERTWRRKVAGLLRWARGPYQERFQTRSLTVAVVATVGTRRHDELRRWTEKELTAQQAAGEGDLFRFTSCQPERINPAELFLQPVWRTPFSDRAHALVALSEVAISPS